ncbi:MAG TPA: TonB family protein [Polyangiaceae bacterium]|nr:TonB family protein [Polyangiaceae bacterium]
MQSRLGAVAGVGVLVAGILFARARVARAQDAASVPRGNSGAVIKPPAEEPPPPKAVIKDPVLLDFVNATYPPEAIEDGLEATVVLKLTIDREGHVTKVEIPEPVGHGFDEAARAAALQFRFEPATRDGKAIPSIVRYPYKFTLTPVEAAPPPPPTTGILSGRLRLAETDAPLVGEPVTLVGPDGSARQVTTDQDGRWHVENLAPGAYHVKIAVQGFVDIDSVEEVAAGEETDVTLRIKPQTDEIEVIVGGERPAREVTRRTIERREIERIPGTNGDALRSLQSLPGVGRPPGLAGLLIVRGSAPQDSVTFVDGTGVPLIYHFLGLTSVLPTELLDRIDFYPGNFSARFGRAMGGVVDVGLRSPNTQCIKDDGKPDPTKHNCFHGLLQADFIDARVMLEGPLPIKGWSFLAAGRKSLINSWLKPALEATGASVTTAPIYYDYQLIAEHKTAHTRTSLRFYGSDDRVAFIINDPFVQDPALGGSLRYGTAFYRAQLFYQTDLSSKATLTANLSAGKDSINFSVGNVRFDLKTVPIEWRYELGYTFTKGVKFNSGLDFELAPFDVHVRAPDPPRPGEPDPGPYAARPPREANSKGLGFRPAWYGEFELQPIERLRLVPGLRADFARDSGHGDLAPRISGRYDFVKGADADHPDRRKTTLKGGAGVYYQPPQFQETDLVFGTPGLYSNRAVHYSVGIEQELTRQIDVSIEGFYKDMTDLVARGLNEQGAYTYNNLGTGYVVGGETLIRYKPDAHFFGWIAYTLSRSVRRDGPDLPQYLFQYDQTHNLTVLGSYRLGRGWEFGARFSLVSGSLDTPTLMQTDPGALPALYASDAGTYAKLDGTPFSRRLPLRHQLDLRVDKRWQVKKVRISTYLDIQNVYNHASVEGFTYNYNFSQTGYQKGLPIIPSIGFRMEI